MYSNIDNLYTIDNLLNLINDPLEGNFYSSHLKKTKEPAMFYKQKNNVKFIIQFICDFVN